MGPERISRRELLRNVGLAGTAAWAAPALTTMRASASVERCTKKKARRLCKRARCNNCDGQGWFCGTCSSDVGDGSWCFARSSDLRCTCAEDVFCAEAGQCTTNADCEAQGLGNVCITLNGCTGCGSSTAVCSTRCCTPLDPGQTRALKPRRLGRTAAGR